MPPGKVDQEQSSQYYFERAKRVIAGGVSHEARYVEPFPIYVDRARGSRKWDIDGNEYVDFSMGSASLLLGHAHPEIVQALQKQAQLGTYYANCHPLEVEWAELVQEMFPSAERIRFVASGTEATMLAIRLARAYTGRTKIIRFPQHYNGWHDYAIYGLKFPYDKPNSLGVPPAVAAMTVVCQPDVNRVEAVLKSDPDIAGIICEASGPSWGSAPLVQDFLRAMPSLANKYGAVLIFDEVITGFRWSPGGMQAVTGVKPDLTTFAKILTGGLPGGAVGGREEVMRLLDPSYAFEGMQPAVFHRGTFNGAPIVAAAGVAALKIARTGEAQRHANDIAQRIRDGMQKILNTHQVAGLAYGAASTFHLYLSPKPMRGGIDTLTVEQIRGLPKEVVNGYHQGLRKRGVDLMSYMGGVTSLAHTDEDVDIALGAFEETIRDLILSGFVARV